MEPLANPAIETRTREQLAEELQALTKEAENLMKSSGDDFEQQAEGIQRKLKGVLDLFGASYETIEEKATAGVKAADQSIRRNPYPAIGLALAAGVVIGCLIKRK